jgi:hypothetical protein
VGNWQLACKSHYWIYRGKIRWSDKWTPEKIAAGRRGEEERRSAYHDALDHQNDGILKRFLRWVKVFLKR